jgi:hypothetical protein
MTKHRPSGKVSLSVTHVIENADVDAFGAWAAGLVQGEAGAGAAGLTYFGGLAHLPMPDELLAFPEDGGDGAGCAIRCVAFYYGVPKALDPALLTERLTLLWALSGAGVPVPHGSRVDLLHVAVGPFQVGGPVLHGHPHLPWALTQIGAPAPADPAAT